MVHIEDKKATIGPGGSLVFIVPRVYLQATGRKPGSTLHALPDVAGKCIRYLPRKAAHTRPVKLQQWGGSVSLTINADYAKLGGLEKGSKIAVLMDPKDQALILQW